MPVRVSPNSTEKPFRVRVIAHIVRSNLQYGFELLVFDHRDYPDAGMQIPGGGVDKTESPDQAVHREIEEESGLTDCTMIKKLGVFESRFPTPNILRHHHAYLLRAPDHLPERWEHTVTGGGDDESLVFCYYWLPLSTKIDLIPGQREYLPMIIATLNGHQMSK